MNTNELENKRLNDSALTLAKTLAAAFEQAGYTVKLTGKDKAVTTAPFKIQVDKGEMTRWVTLDMVGNNRWSSVMTKVQVEYQRSSAGYGGRGSNFSKRLRYSKLDGITERLLTNLAEDAALFDKMAESRKQAEQMQADADAQRASELNGVVLPPGANATVITGNGPDAGKYTFTLDRYEGFVKKALTAEQVAKLFAVMNDIMGTPDLFVIRSISTHPDGTPLTRYYKNGDWYRLDSFDTFTQAEIDRVLPEAKQRAGVAWQVEVLPYASVATIPTAVKG